MTFSRLATGSSSSTGCCSGSGGAGSDSGSDPCDSLAASCLALLAALLLRLALDLGAGVALLGSSSVSAAVLGFDSFNFGVRLAVLGVWITRQLDDFKISR